MNYLPINPYHTEVEVKAWGEGLTTGLHTIGTRDELNPYTPADTCVAWATGFDAARYVPAPVDWEGIDWSNPAIDQSIFEVFDPDTGVREAYMVLNWRPYVARPNTEAPAWAENRWQERSIRLTAPYLRNAMMYAIRHQGEGTIELPCPPYEYEAEGNRLTITAGAYTKTGTKQEWEAVLEEMVAEVEALPDGIDVSSVSVSVDVTQTATARWTAQVEANDLLHGYDQYEDDIWSGTMDELADALDEAVGNLDGSEVESYYADIEYELDTYGDVEIEAQDINYDLDDATEL